MACVRRRLRSGVAHFYVIDSYSVTAPGGKRARKTMTRGFGTGKLAKAEADAAAAELNRIRRRSRLGLPIEEGPVACRWTLADLKARDLADAKSRGLTSLPRRESHWAQLLAGFGADLALDRVTPAAIDRYARARREAGVGPAVVNRDLRSCLSPALKLARRLREESGYAGNPFADLPLLEEKSHRRKPRILTEAEFGRLIRTAWALARGAVAAGRPWAADWLQNAAIVELWFLTASRFNQVLRLRREDVRADMVVFPRQKGGNVRAFVFEGSDGERVRELLTSGGIPNRAGLWVFPGSGGGPRVGMRHFWETLTELSELPGLKPHDLRHTASREALRQGRGILGVQGILGHTTPGATERVYLELFPERMRAVGWPEGGRANRKNSTAKRKAL